MNTYIFYEKVPEVQMIMGGTVDNQEAFILGVNVILSKNNPHFDQAQYDALMAKIESVKNQYNITNKVVVAEYDPSTMGVCARSADTVSTANPNRTKL